jgi:hypothetical protein
VRLEPAPAGLEVADCDLALQHATGDRFDVGTPLVDAWQDVIARDEDQRTEREVGRHEGPERETDRAADQPQGAQPEAPDNRLLGNLDAALEPFLDRMLDPVRGGAEFGGQGVVASAVVAVGRRRIRTRVIGHDARERM